MIEKVVAVVPALNEEELLARVLKPLLEAKEQNIISEVVVVDDGSTDSTRQLALNSGATVLYHNDEGGNPQNRGKPAAFKTALKYCKEVGADIIFTSDADMLNLTPEKVETFLSGIRDKKDVHMIRSSYNQTVNFDPADGVPQTDGRFNECPPPISGFRAIRVKALQPILNGNPKWNQYLNEGNLSLELALEYLIHKSHKRELTIPLVSRIQGGGETHIDSIIGDINKVMAIPRIRAGLAKDLRNLRTISKHDPDDPIAGGKTNPQLREIVERLDPDTLSDVRAKAHQLRKKEKQ
jgi:glycosyltransferase involved in cell wall biosynthesis